MWSWRAKHGCELGTPAPALLSERSHPETTAFAFSILTSRDCNVFRVIKIHRSLSDLASMRMICAQWRHQNSGWCSQRSQEAGLRKLPSSTPETCDAVTLQAKTLEQRSGTQADTSLKPKESSLRCCLPCIYNLCPGGAVMVWSFWGALAGSGSARGYKHGYPPLGPLFRRSL